MISDGAYSDLFLPFPSQPLYTRLPIYAQWLVMVRTVTCFSPSPPHHGIPTDLGDDQWWCVQWPVSLLPSPPLHTRIPRRWSMISDVANSDLFLPFPSPPRHTHWPRWWSVLVLYSDLILPFPSPPLHTHLPMLWSVISDVANSDLFLPFLSPPRHTHWPRWWSVLVLYSDLILPFPSPPLHTHLSMLWSVISDGAYSDLFLPFPNPACPLTLQSDHLGHLGWCRVW
jgi:hypothetical protein